MPGRGAYPNQSARITRAAITPKPEDGVRPALFTYFFGGGSIQAIAGGAAGLASMVAGLHVLRSVGGATLADSWGAADFTRALRLTGFTSGAGITSGTSRLLHGLAGIATAGVDAAGVMRLARSLAAAAVGLAAIHAHLARLRILAGSVLSAGGIGGTVAIGRTLVGACAAMSRAAGKLSLARALAAATLGAAAARAHLVRLRVLIGAAHSGGLPLGRLAVVRSFAGRGAGWSAIVGTLLSAVRMILARTVSARREVRTVVIGFEERSVHVRGEQRAITPAVEARSVTVRKGKRQIDA